MRVNIKEKLTFTQAVILLLIIDALFVWPYAYRQGYGHGDVQSMEFALFFGLKNHNPLPHFAYGRDFSFGWYYLIFWLSKLLKFPLEPDTFPWVANLLASFASTVTLICLLGVLDKLFSLNIALPAVILWRFIPEIWELSTYAHPWTIAMPFFTAGAWIYVAQSGKDINQMFKFYLACISAAVMMTISLCIRADLVFFMPLLVASVYFRRRKDVLPLMVIMVSSCILFFLLRYLVVGATRTSVIDFFVYHAELKRIPLHLALALYPISGYLFATTRALTKKSSFSLKYLIAGSVALVPTLLFWLPIGGPYRHFAPLYVLVAVLCAYGLKNWLRISTSLAVIMVVLSNMLIAELGFRIFSPMFPPRSVQIGVQRRVMESVPLGIPWLNHAAQQRLNELREWYSVNALAHSDEYPVIFAQMDPWRLCVLAIHRFGTVKRIKNDVGLTVWQLGASNSAAWVVDIPENADVKWLESLQSFAEHHRRELRFLGPRIPKTLFTVLKDQQALIVPQIADRDNRSRF